MLRLSLVATIIVPLVLGVVAAYLSYLDAYHSAITSASEAVAVATENTTKILDTHLLVAARISDLLGSMTDDQIHPSESQFHDRIAQQIAGFPEVAAAWVIGSDGRELVSARVFPVNRDLDQSNRDDFRAFRNSDLQTYIWMLRARSLNTGEFQPYFTVSLRRSAADGHFNGIVVIAVSSSYFGSFYNSLLGATEDYTASIIRDDGTVLAQYPEPAGSSTAPQPDPLLAKAIANGMQSGVDANGTPLDGGRVVAIKRVGDYPVYVAIERKKASILQDWLWSIVGYIVVGVPSAIGLIALSLLALRRTRSEQQALARASEALKRRADLEVELHRAQRLEAVGLLTAGFAHDFNNLLTIISVNVERLEGRVDEEDARSLKMLAAARDGCGRAATLSKRLLMLSRQEPINPQAVDVNQIILTTLELPWRSGDFVTCEFRLYDKLWPASVDADQLATALLNLAFNARDAMPKGGQLTIGTTNVSLNDRAAAETAGVPLGDYVGIFFKDTGHGMPEEVRNRAFDAFFTTKEPGKGTGLGLSLVNAFVRRSGGYCAIDSEPGRGAMIRIYLPRHSAGPETASGRSDNDARSNNVLTAVFEPTTGQDRSDQF
jgi:two-component system, NtrC family, sensor kinase